MDEQTRKVLLSILEVLKTETAYLHRQHGWVIAVSETVEKHPDLAVKLRDHPFYNQGPRPDVNITASLLEQVDLLLQQLTHP